MTSIDFRNLPYQQAYKLLLGAVSPRPIAWVSTINKSGLTNLAPFSFFNAVCSNPPTLLFCPARHTDGRKKDTLRNIEETKEFVVHIVSEELAQTMNATSAEFDSTISEFDECKIESIPSSLVKPPRIKAAPIAMECILDQIIHIGDGSAGSGSIVIGRVQMIHVIDAAHKDGRIMVEIVRPIARLAGFKYCPVRDIFELPRPELKKP